MAQQQDQIKALERRVRKLERMLEAVINHTNAGDAVAQAEATAAEERQARSAATSEQFSQSRANRRIP
jgi:hypothetical protein